MDIPILYEDNHLLIVEKPMNMPVQEDASGDPDLLTLLKKDLKIRYNKAGNVYLGLVHRLDRPVGGAIVFAKTSKAASRLADALRKRNIQRKYLAVVRGIPRKKEALLEHFLYKNARKNLVQIVSRDHQNGKKAVLEYKVLGSRDNLSLLAVKLHTGRSHQIRVQLAGSGFPLFGDQKYGQHANRPGQQIALWAYSLEFEHPVKKEAVKIESCPPNKHPWNLWDYVKTR
jgi:23S rRNA pseudouridine1911/1915/1917 synthase